MRRITAYILTLLVAGGCVVGSDNQEPSDGKAEVVFTLTVPEALEVKAFTGKTIRCLDLLVFDENSNYMERIQVNEVYNYGGSGSIWYFGARLAASNIPRTIHIIANGRGEGNADLIDFNNITAGMSESTTIPALTTETLAPGEAPGLPLMMWGRATVSSVSSTLYNNYVSADMLRSVASVHVKCATPTADNGLDNFELLGFSIINASNRGRVVPAGFTSPAAVPSTVTLPQGVADINYHAGAGTGVWAPASGNTAGELYLYEKDNTGTVLDLAVIIHAKWNGTEGYYLVWMRNSLPVDVIRNHRYCLMVNGVWGTGYAAPPQSFPAGYDSGISVSITDTHDDVTDVITDGRYWLGVPSKVAVSGSGTIEAASVYSDSPYTLTATADVSWITNIAFTTGSSADQWKMSAVFATTSVTRTGTVTIRTGNLTRTITVTQNP